MFSQIFVSISFSLHRLGLDSATIKYLKPKEEAWQTQDLSQPFRVPLARPLKKKKPRSTSLNQLRLYLRRVYWVLSSPCYCFDLEFFHVTIPCETTTYLYFKITLCRCDLSPPVLHTSLLYELEKKKTRCVTCPSWGGRFVPGWKYCFTRTSPRKIF